MRVTKKRTSAKNVLGLTAADLMSAPVTSIPHDMLLREAGHRMKHERISGAPVVDAEGKCVGILSSSDFVGWAESGGEMEEKSKGAEFYCALGRNHQSRCV